MIDQVVDKTVDISKQNKIVIETFCTQMSVVLGSEVCQNILEMMLKSPDSNLQHDQSAMYVQVLWELNFRII